MQDTELGRLRFVRGKSHPHPHRLSLKSSERICVYPYDSGFRGSQTNRGAPKDIGLLFLKRGMASATGRCVSRPSEKRTILRAFDAGNLGRLVRSPSDNCVALRKTSSPIPSHHCSSRVVISSTLSKKRTPSPKIPSVLESVSIRESMASSISGTASKTAGRATESDTSTKKTT